MPEVLKFKKAGPTICRKSILVPVAASWVVTSSVDYSPSRVVNRNFDGSMFQANGSGELARSIPLTGSLSVWVGPVIPADDELHTIGPHINSRKQPNDIETEETICWMVLTASPAAGLNLCVLQVGFRSTCRISRGSLEIFGDNFDEWMSEQMMGLYRG